MSINVKWLLFVSFAWVAAIVVPLTMVPAAAAESHIYTHNSSDRWVWVTAYERDWTGGYNLRNAGAWCVSPNSQDKHGLRTQIVEVRFEVTHERCSHPVILDTRLGYNHTGPNPITYIVGPKTYGSKGYQVTRQAP